MFDPPYLANPEGFYFHHEDVSGRFFEDAVARLLEQTSMPDFNAAYGILQANNPEKILKKDVVFDSIKTFWLSFDARTNQVVNVDDLNDAVLAHRVLRSASPGAGHWDSIQCRWLKDAMKPLALALAQGHLCIIAQAGPSFGPGQPQQLVDGTIFQTFRWRVHRIGSRLDVLDCDGCVERAYKHAMLILPSAAEAAIASSGHHNSAPIPSLKSDRMIIALEMIKERWGKDYPSTGEDRIVKDFHRQHKDFRLTKTDITGMVQKDRGGKLSRGRQAKSLS